MKRLILIAYSLILVTGVALAGNPERTGQAGATQLLINPWARSAGFNAIDIGASYGLGAMVNNPAGISNYQPN